MGIVFKELRQQIPHAKNTTDFLFNLTNIVFIEA